MDNTLGYWQFGIPNQKKNSKTRLCQIKDRLKLEKIFIMRRRQRIGSGKSA